MSQLACLFLAQLHLFLGLLVLDSNILSQSGLYCLQLETECQDRGTLVVV